MQDLIPEFDIHKVFIEPWQVAGEIYVWVVLMGFFVTLACGLVGVFLVLRRMSLVGDAISHSILPGLVIAFLISGTLGSVPMFVGALVAGVLTTAVIEIIYKTTRVKQDAAIGIVFSSFFAVGVILISLFAQKVHLDTDCVLYGEIAFVPLEPHWQIGIWNLGPLPVARMGLVAVLTVVVIVLFYKEFLVTSFDPGLAASLGMNVTGIHYGLMCLLSVVVVSAFESVGAILVIAMLIIPGASALLLCQRIPSIMVWVVVHAALSSFFGMHLGLWLDCSIAGAMVVVATALFVSIWVGTSLGRFIQHHYGRVKHNQGIIREKVIHVPL